jgi:hypothetical protein
MPDLPASDESFPNRWQRSSLTGARASPDLSDDARRWSTALAAV